MTVEASPKFEVEEIASIAHEVVRMYARAIGEPMPSWGEIGEEARARAMDGVCELLVDVSRSAAGNHESWCARMVSDGWCHGPKKDPKTKEHPCLVSWEALPHVQRAKNFLFISVVRGLQHARRDQVMQYAESA